MKKAQRVVYLALANEIGACLCMFCRHPEWENMGCCEGYPICSHPIERVCEEHECLEPGDDCWGFSPDGSVSMAADIVGVVLSQDYDRWSIRTYSKAAVTVYGRTAQGDETKVRLGHDGKPTD